MNYDLPEVFSLLAQLDAARAALDEHDERPGRFEIFVIPNAAASPDLHDELSALGVTATLAPLWELFGDAPPPLPAKHEALSRYAEGFIAR